MARRILSIDYTAIAEHLAKRLEEAQDPDAPVHQLEFFGVRGILTSHVQELALQLHKPFNRRRPDSIFGERDVNEDTVLTDLLFADQGESVVIDMAVSSLPGHVARVKGKTFIMPAVIIEVE